MGGASAVTMRENKEGKSEKGKIEDFEPKWSRNEQKKLKNRDFEPKMIFRQISSFAQKLTEISKFSGKNVKICRKLWILN